MPFKMTDEISWNIEVLRELNNKSREAPKLRDLDLELLDRSGISQVSRVHHTWYIFVGYE